MGLRHSRHSPLAFLYMHLSGINIMLGLPIHKEVSLPEEHSDFIFSIIQPSKLHAEIIFEAN